MAKALQNEIAVSDAVRAALDKLALASRILEMEGHGNFTLGHLAMRDPEGRGVWIKRWGLTLGEVMDWTDHQLIDFDGNLLYGDAGKRHSEWPIHVGIYKRRPDVNATAHTHPRYGTVYSCTSAPLRPLANAGSFFAAPPPRYVQTSELIRTPAAGDALAETLGAHNAMFLRNHGVVFGGASIEMMTIAGVQLEEACRHMLEIAATGLPYDWPDDAEQARKAPTMDEPRNIALFFDHFATKLAATQALGHPSLPAQRRR
ncbi:MAG: class II aldolase/adducin family protein [Rhodospirillales bacterium]